MFNIGTPELILLLLIAFVVFGPKHLPKLARTVGRLIGDWRKLTGDLEKTIRDEVETKDEKAAPPDAKDGAGRDRPADETQRRLPG
jgi:sec-independent protein translocase protein TatB